jgi:hypothetical protein
MKAAMGIEAWDVFTTRIKLIVSHPLIFFISSYSSDILALGQGCSWLTHHSPPLTNLLRFQARRIPA